MSFSVGISSQSHDQFAPHNQERLRHTGGQEAIHGFELNLDARPAMFWVHLPTPIVLVDGVCGGGYFSLNHEQGNNEYLLAAKGPKHIDDG
jgi:hypothetical protein